MRTQRDSRKGAVSWIVVIPVFAALLGLFAFGLHRNSADLRAANSNELLRQYDLSRKEEELQALKLELRNVGSMGYIETRARTELGYLKPGELRFEVTNPELLDSYTETEWQILLQEMSMGE